MLINRFRFVILLLVVLYSLPPLSLEGQDTPAYRADMENRFEELMENPENFASDERVDIYLHEVSKQLVVSLDSAYVGYERMLEYGHKLGDSLMIGIAYGSQASVIKMKGNFANSLNKTRKSSKYLISYPKYLSGSYASISGAYMALNQLDSAELYISKAMELTFEIQDSMEFTNRWITRAQIYIAQNRYSSAIECYQEALKYIHLAHSRLREVNCYSQMSVLYREFGDTENSNFYLDKGLKVAKEQGYKSSINKLMLHMGRNRIKQGKLNEALKLYSEVLSQMPQDKISKTTFEIHCLITDVALKLNDQALAERHHTKMNAQYSTKYTRYEDLYNLTNSDYYLAKNDLQKTIFHAQKVVNSPKPLIVIQAYKNMANINQKKGNWNEAFAYQDSVLKVTNRTKTLAQQNIIYDYESKYQKALQEKEISLLTKDQEIQKMKLSKQSGMLYFSLFGLLLAIFAVLGIVYAYRTKLKSNHLLQDKNSKLSTALENNKMLIKEIHHRVKNNLQVVSSLLNLQSRFEKDSTIVKAINTGKYRVQSMSLLHQNLYINEDLKSIHIKKYFEDLANTLVSEYPLPNTKIKLHLDIEDLELDIDTVVPLGLISNELITNVLKYAFKDQAIGNLHFTISEIMGKVRMKVSDDGVGMPFTELPLKKRSMGYQLVQSFAKKIKADINIDNSKGTTITLVFEKKLNPKLLKETSNVAS